MNNILLSIENVEYAKIISRPSKISKTPYVADIILNKDIDTNIINTNINDTTINDTTINDTTINDTTINDTNINDTTIIDYNSNIIYQAHSPSLGCCGLCEKNCNILVYPLISKNICKYRIFLSEFYEEDKEYIGYIGIEPKIAEDIVENAIKNNNISKLQNVKSYKREVKLLNSRFDYVGIDENDNTFILEVKNVPLADYVDLPTKEKNLMNFDDKNFDEKIAYFPDGYRKNKGDIVSERALKHINELKIIKINTANSKLNNTRCIICYVIQRDDINSFQVSNLDKIYKEAFNDAIKNGVEIITIVTQWNYNKKNKLSECKFITDNLLINL